MAGRPKFKYPRLPLRNEPKQSGDNFFCTLSGNINFEQQEVAMPDYEIYALKYAGPFVRTGVHLMWYQDWDKIEKINYYLNLV